MLKQEVIPMSAEELDAQGWCVIRHLLAVETCGALATIYEQEEHFRSRVIMARHGFGRGEYKYFRYPLPSVIQQLRDSMYQQLAPIANRWNERLGVGIRFPEHHSQFLDRC